MKKEKIVLSFFAVLIGIGMALAGFFIYQYTRQVKPSDVKGITIKNPTPSPESSIFLTVDEPADEEVVSERSIRIRGKTVPNAKIVILTQVSEEAAVPADDGSFSTDITIDEGENIIQVSAVSPQGEVVSVKRVVTYTTENF